MGSNFSIGDLDLAALQMALCLLAEESDSWLQESINEYWFHYLFMFSPPPFRIQPVNSKSLEHCAQLTCNTKFMCVK